MRSVLFAVLCWAISAFLSVSAEPISFDITETIEPVFNSNAPQSEKDPESGPSIESNLSAAIRGSARDKFDYVFVGTLRNERFFDFPDQNYDYLIGGAGISKEISGYKLAINAASYSVFRATFSEFHSQYFDINAIAQTNFLAFGKATIIPAIYVTRRFSDHSGQQWSQIAPLMAIGIPALYGSLVFSAEYDYRLFDKNGRVDHRLLLAASWTKMITERTRFGVKGELLDRWSSKNGFFSDFSIGPVLRVTLIP